jgi:hypothetical protein
MVIIISLNINDVFDDVTADTALSQKYTGFSYRKTIGYLVSHENNLYV